MNVNLNLPIELGVIHQDICGLKSQVAALAQPDPQTPLAVIGFTADAGEIGGPQTDASARLQSFIPNAVFFGGDNIYDGAVTADKLNAAWAAFSWAVAKKIAFPAIGNHDRDGDPTGAFTVNKFASETGGNSYYSVRIGNAEFFVLDDGIDTDGDSVSTDLTDIRHAQYWWLSNAIRSSAALFKVVVIHHPFVSTAEDQTFTSLDWNFESLGIDLVLSGHVHGAEHFMRQGMHILNNGSVNTEKYEMNVGLFGTTDATQLIWVDTSAGGSESVSSVVKITVYPRKLWVENVRVSNGQIIHSFGIHR